MEPPTSGPTTCRERYQGQVHCKQQEETGHTDCWWQTDGSTDVEHNLFSGKELEQIQEVERYWLDIVGLTSMHCTGSDAKLLDRGWTQCGNTHKVPAEHQCVEILSRRQEGFLNSTSGC